MNTINIRALQLGRADEIIWHPFMPPIPQERPCMVRAEGIILTDICGRRYYDAVSGLWNTPLGYSVPAIKESVSEQMQRMPFCSPFTLSSELTEEAASVLLSSVAPSLNRVIWGCTGSESIECAIKLMRAYHKCSGKTHRTTIVSLEGSYHGTHYGSLSISGIEKEAQADIAPILPDTALLKPPAEYDPPEVIQELTEIASKWILQHNNQIAGLVIEPILASSGAKVVSPTFLQSICNICREHDIPVTFDEVTTGFYRTGSLFYHQCIDLVPDILCLSKAINNGFLPLSAVVVSNQICQRFRENSFVLQHGTTQGGNLCALAAMIAANQQLSLLAKMENLSEKAGLFYEMLVVKMQQHNYVETVRHKGFMYAIMLPEYTDRRDINRLVNAILQEGVIVYPAEHGFLLLPCFCTTHEQWKIIVEAISHAMRGFTQGGGA